MLCKKLLKKNIINTFISALIALGTDFYCCSPTGLRPTGEPSREQNNRREALASMEYGFVAFEGHNVLHMLGMVSVVSLGEL